MGSGAFLGRPAAPVEGGFEPQPCCGTPLPIYGNKRATATDRCLDRLPLRARQGQVNPIDPIGRTRDRPLAQCEGIGTSETRKTAPRPGLGSCDQSSAQRVSLHVPAHGQEVFVVLNREGAEASLVEVSGADCAAKGMPSLNVCHRQPAHKNREFPVRPRPHHEMPVIWHHAVRHEPCPCSRARFFKHLLKRPVVAIAEEDPVLSIGSVQDVVDHFAHSNSWWPRHAAWGTS